jgi:hypothetical protein
MGDAARTTIDDNQSVVMTAGSRTNPAKHAESGDHP